MAFRATYSLFNRSVLTGHLAKESLPPLAAKRELPFRNLYQQLSIMPKDGVGLKVRQRKWVAKGLDVPRNKPLGSITDKNEDHLCYWEVTRVRLKDGGNHGKAWGRLFWRGES